MKKRSIVLAVSIGVVVLGLTGVFIVNDLSRKGSNKEGIVLSDEVVVKPVYKRINVEEARDVMNGSQPFVLLDVRTNEEFAEHHLKGALLIPDHEIRERVEVEIPDKDTLIIVYCRSGARSHGAVNILTEMGYTNVYDLGGIIDWPYDTINENAG